MPFPRVVDTSPWSAEQPAHDTTMTRSNSFDFAPEGEDMSQQGGLRRSVKFATALLVASVVVLGIAGLAHASNITVTNTAQLPNAFSSPSPCSTTIGPCPDTTPG